MGPKANGEEDPAQKAEGRMQKKNAQGTHNEERKRERERSKGDGWGAAAAFPPPPPYLPELRYLTTSLRRTDHHHHSPAQHPVWNLIPSGWFSRQSAWLRVLLLVDFCRRALCGVWDTLAAFWRREFWGRTTVGFEDVGQDFGWNARSALC